MQYITLTVATSYVNTILFKKALSGLGKSMHSLTWSTTFPTCNVIRIHMKKQKQQPQYTVSFTN